jgi:DNA-binding NarL/FixJ family response regulator
MLIVRAIEILERMRDGKEPVSGKILTSEGPWQSAEVVRALYTVLAALPESAREEPAEETAPSTKPRLSRAGKPWTDEEDRCLAVAFDEGRGVPEIARLLDRSRKAVRLRLVKLGRIAAEDAPAPRRRREPAIASTG